MKSKRAVWLIIACFCILIATVAWGHDADKKACCGKSDAGSCCAKQKASAACCGTCDQAKKSGCPQAGKEKSCCGSCSKPADKKSCCGSCKKQGDKKACCGSCGKAKACKPSCTKPCCQKACSKGVTLDFDKFDPKQWNLEGVEYELVDFKGKKAIHIQKKNKDRKVDGAMAVLKGMEFDNGTIEFDMASKIFSGAVFRVQDDSKAECVYFRPFNSGTEKHKNTVQYVARGNENTWKYLRENFPGKYEAGADLKELEWFHVRLEVCCSFVKVFINDAPDPCLVVKDLKFGQSKGKVGLWAWNGYFANLKVTPKAS